MDCTNNIYSVRYRTILDRIYMVSNGNQGYEYEKKLNEMRYAIFVQLIENIYVLLETRVVGRRA